MENKDIRWKQRFHNFEKAFKKLEEALNKDNLSELERNGLIQRFEFTMELAWKTLKDFMENQGFVFTSISPKVILREAFQNGLIKDGQAWMDAMEWRNKLSHNHDEHELRKARKR